MNKGRLPREGLPSPHATAGDPGFGAAIANLEPIGALAEEGEAEAFGEAGGGGERGAGFGAKREVILEDHNAQGFGGGGLSRVFCTENCGKVEDDSEEQGGDFAPFEGEEEEGEGGDLEEEGQAPIIGGTKLGQRAFEFLEKACLFFGGKRQLPLDEGDVVQDFWPAAEATLCPLPTPEGSCGMIQAVFAIA